MTALVGVILRYLGHGRALETFLGFLKITIGVNIIFTTLSERTPTLVDLTWFVSSAAIGAPFIVVGGLQFSGAMLNMAGYEWSWIPRSTSALLAILMWSICLVK